MDSDPPTIRFAATVADMVEELSRCEGDVIVTLFSSCHGISRVWDPRQAVSAWAPRDVMTVFAEEMFDTAARAEMGELSHGRIMPVLRP